MIPLTRGLVALVSDVDSQWALSRRWHAGKAGGRFYAATGRHMRMHRLVAERAFGDLGAFEIDHINGDSLDNRRENLRLATRAQNARNGVHPITMADGHERWGAQIRIAGATRTLGYFDRLEDAVRAYDAAGQEHFGAFFTPSGGHHVR